MRKQYRLRRSADFERLRQAGRAIHKTCYIFSFSPNGLTHNRYGFVTGKRLGNAIQRNRIRRRLRAILQSLHSRLKVGYDIVIIGRVAIVEKPFVSLKRNIEQTLEEVGLLSQETAS